MFAPYGAGRHVGQPGLVRLFVEFVPLGEDFWGAGEGLHDDAVLLGFFPEGAKLIGSGVGGADVEVEADGLEADGDVFGNAEGAAKIEIAFGGDFDALGGDAHSSGDHLAGDLGAGSEGAEEEITGASGGACPADSLMGFGLIDCAADVD